MVRQLKHGLTGWHTDRTSLTVDLSELKNLKLALKLSGLEAKKSYGQNFLVDKEALETIVDSAVLSSDDTVLEIGPGLGVLTDELVKHAGRVVAVEADAELAELLERRAQDNLTVVATDALQYDLAQLPRGYKVVANLPYYITSLLLRFLLESENKPVSITVLVQKEVAERIIAQPGQMSVLACSVQYYGAPRLVRVVPAASFYPSPKVDSAILHIDLGTEPAFVADTKKLFRLIKAGFGEKRKMLRNALAGGLAITGEQAVALIASAGLKETARAQELSLAEWKKLYQAYDAFATHS